MDISKLSSPFPPDVVMWRVGPTNRDKTKGMALAYIDARDVQDRLTEVCGPFGWQCRHEVSGDKRVTCHIGIKNPETNEWIWRSDGAGETDVDGEKGSYSDSFKRAAVKWGVGRYLYDIRSPWVAIEQHGRSYSIVASELNRLAGLLSNGSTTEQAAVTAPTSTLSELGQSLCDELATIENRTELEAWGVKVKEISSQGKLSHDDRQLLVQPYKARATYLDRKQQEAA